jgi:DNA-binding beta-propeller fold protein YncE
MNPRPHRYLPSTLLLLAIGAGPVWARPVEPGRQDLPAQSGVVLDEAYHQVGGWSSLSGAQLPPLAFNRPSGLGMDLDPFSGELGVYVADSGNHHVQVFSADGPYRRTIGGPGPLPAGLNDPVDVAVQGSLVFVADRGHGRVALFTTEGQYVGQWTDLADPTSIAVSPTGRIAVIEQASSQVAIYQADGKRLGRLWRRSRPAQSASRLGLPGGWTAGGGRQRE